MTVIVGLVDVLTLIALTLVVSAPPSRWASGNRRGS
jgi:hypothetical protein